MSLMSSLGALVLGTVLLFTIVFGEELASLRTPASYTAPPANTSATAPLPRLSSTFADEAIPDILLRNATYQQANALGSQTNVRAESAAVIDATVNIFCTHTTDTAIRTTTGTGFVISPQGAVITNAHVAQFLLLEDSELPGERRCVLRTGSPATSTYEARLLYVPPAWILKNAALIDAEAAVGTGERDYALMYIARRLDNAPIPARFPHLLVESGDFSLSDRGRSLVAAGYPANTLAASGTASDLLFIRATTTLTDIYTFTESTPDVLALSETPVSAPGSSGGPIINEQGNAIGLITTRGTDPQDSLRALTFSYIDRTLIEETGFSIAQTTTGDLAWRSKIFNEALAPFLRQYLEYELE